MKIMKRIVSYFSLLLLIVSFSASSLTGMQIKQSISPQTASIQRAHSYAWIYQTINGVMYKRLYNKTTGEWASDWMPV